MREELSEEELIKLRRIVLTFRAIDVNSIMNAYAIENVVFGELKPNDKIPFERFVEDLDLKNLQPYAVRDCIEGVAITKEETVAEKNIDFFYHECFIFHMNYLFDSAPYSKRKDDDENGLRPFAKEGLNAYIMRLYPMFKSILKTKAEHDFFTLVSPFPNRSEQTSCYEKIAKLLTAIITRGLRQGACIDRYVKDIGYLPYFVEKIIKVINGRYLLANSDPETLDFRLAVLSAIQFMNAEHTQLFECKAKKWAGID